MIRSGKYGQALLIVGAATLVAELLFRSFGIAHLSVVFLAAVLIAGLRLGARAGVLAAGAAFFIYNFYLVEPRFTFSFATAEDYITLAVFLAAALLTGAFAGYARDQRDIARSRAEKLGLLFDISRTFSQTEDPAVLRRKLLRVIAEACHGEASLELEGDLDARLPESASDVGHGKATIRNLLLTRATPFITIRVGDWRGRLLQSGDRRIGYAIWRVPGLPHDDTVELDTFIDVLVDLGAAAIGRAWTDRERAGLSTIQRA